MNRIHHPEPEKASVRNPTLAAYINMQAAKQKAMAQTTTQTNSKPHLLLQELRVHDPALKSPSGTSHAVAEKMKALNTVNFTTPGGLMARRHVSRT